MSQNTVDISANQQRRSISAATSQSINVARVLCIFFMIFVHIWPNFRVVDPAVGVRPIDVVLHFFTDVLGRSSVPLLSVISGWLVASSYKGAWSSLVKSRFRSMIVPLILWNIIFFSLLLIYSWLTKSSIKETFGNDLSLKFIINTIFSVSDFSINYPIAFVRDLFICIIIFPIISYIAKKRNIITYAASLLLVVYGIYGHSSIFILRPAILCFFFFGVFIYNYNINIENILLRNIILLFSIFSVFIIYSFEIAPNINISIFDSSDPLYLFIIRASVSYIFWQLAVYISRSNIEVFFRNIVQYVFFVFCIHAIIIKLMSPIGKYIFDGYNAYYPVYFFMQPFVVFAVGIVSAILLNRYAPVIFRYLNGGKALRTRLPNISNKAI